MNRFCRCILSCCFDGGDDVPPPTQRRIPQHPQNQTAPYFQQAQYQKTQLRSQYPTEFQRREYGHTSPSPPRPKKPLPPSKSPTYQHHQKKNDHQPPARPIKERPAPNFNQQPEKISERSSSPGYDAIPQDFYLDEKPDNFQRLSSPWDDITPQDGYPESPETDFDPILTPPSLYHRYPPKQEEHHTSPQPTTVSTPATGRRNVLSSYHISYYFGNSPNVVTSWRPPPSPHVPHYDVLSWAMEVEEETEREEQGGEKEEETRRQDPRIVSNVSSLSYYTEAGPQHRRPVSDVSSVSSYYSEQRESRALTPIPEVRKWGNAKYEDARREESNWL